MKAMEGIYRECGVELVNLINKRYNMDINLDALLSLSLSLSNENDVSVSASKASKVEKEVVVSFPIPFNKNKVNRELCQGLCYNHGLFTQCQKKQTDEKGLCKGCSKEAEKSKTGSPNCGTIEARLATDLMEYTDAKGRKPIAYVKVLDKLSISIETVKEMASKENIEIDSIHFEMAEAKRGRPKTKITKKVEATTVEDLFATLVNEELNDVDSIVETVVMSASDEEKDKEIADKEAADKETKLAADKAAKETKLAADKASKEAKIAAEKEAKEAKLAADKAAKEAKLAADKEAKEAKLKEKEAKLAAEKEAKEAKLAADKETKLKEKEAKLAEKEAKLAADKAAKEAKLADKEAPKEKVVKEKVQKEKVSKKKEETVAAVVADKEAAKEKKEEENPTKVSVKRITIDGKEYFKTAANILYDPETKEEVGLYDAETNSIKELPDDSDNELQEDEYDSDN